MNIEQVCYLNLTTSAKAAVVEAGIVKQIVAHDYYLVLLTPEKARKVPVYKVVFANEVYPTRNRADNAAEAAQKRFKNNAVDKAVRVLQAYAPHMLIGE